MSVRFIPMLAGLLSLCPAVSPGQAPERSLLRQLYGDLAMEVRTRGAGSVTIGVADARTSVIVSVMAIDLRRWSDSAMLVLTARAPRRGQSAQWNAAVDGPGVSGGTIALTRQVAPGDTSIVLLVTDAGFKAVRGTLSMVEARALAQAMRRAAMAVLAPPPPKPPPR